MVKRKSLKDEMLLEGRLINAIDQYNGETSLRNLPGLCKRLVEVLKKETIEEKLSAIAALSLLSIASSLNSSGSSADARKISNLAIITSKIGTGGGNYDTDDIKTEYDASKASSLKRL